MWNTLKKHWWKALTVVTLLYVLTVGMLAPLHIGIVGAQPSFLETGTTATLEIEGYNTYFTQGENTAWLKLDSLHNICATRIEVVDDTRLKATYQIPNSLPSSDKNALATLIVNNTAKGYAVYPDAVSIKQTDATDSTNSATWDACRDNALTANTAFTYPFRNVLMETIRNLYFHVPFWFSMLLLFLISMIYSVRHLRNPLAKTDNIAVSFVEVGLLFGFLGIVTGGIWGQYTWGKFWSFDIKQNMSAIALFIYLAYFVLRASFDDEQQKARLSAIYNIFAFVSLIPLLFVIPRMYDSLHPGNGGNPAFGGEDLDNTMRTVFYPAVIAWTLLGVWISTILIRLRNVKQVWIDRMD